MHGCQCSVHIVHSSMTDQHADRFVCSRVCVDKSKTDKCWPDIGTNRGNSLKNQKNNLTSSRRDLNAERYLSLSMLKVQSCGKWLFSWYVSSLCIVYSSSAVPLKFPMCRLRDFKLIKRDSFIFARILSAISKKLICLSLPFLHKQRSPANSFNSDRHNVIAHMNFDVVCWLFKLYESHGGQLGHVVGNVRVYIV